MDLSNLPKITKGYIIISILLIMAVSAVVLLINNTFYLIDSNKHFTIAGVQDGKNKYISKILSIYMIPKNTDWLMFKTQTDNGVPNEEIIKPLNKSDLGFGMRKLTINFTHQYDLSMNGIESDGCTHGDYPKMISYLCAIPKGVVAYDASDPYDSGSYINLPPRPLDILLGANPTTDERTINAEKYKDGLLVLVAKQRPPEAGLPLGDASLKYVDLNGGLTDFKLTGALEDFHNGRYQLITDNGGSEGFGIIDTMKNHVLVYEAPGKDPELIELGLKPNLNIGTACSLNSSTLACYNGVMHDHTHSEEEDEIIDNLGDGSLKIYDTENDKELGSYKVSKKHPITNLCVDEYKNIYTLTEDSVDSVVMENGTTKTRTLVANATALACGDKAHFVANDKAYMIDESGAAHLVYESSLLPIVNIHAFSDKVNLMAKFKSRPRQIYSFSAINREEPYTKQRVSDAVTMIVNENKNVDFDVRFTPQSIDYIVRTYANSDGGVTKDDIGVNAVLETTRKFNLGFQPEVHYLRAR